MANFTKGKWVKQGSFIFSSEKPPRLIAETIRIGLSYGEQQANARLIASAPRLYEALREAEVFTKVDDRVHFKVEQALALVHTVYTEASRSEPVECVEGKE